VASWENAQLWVRVASLPTFSISPFSPEINPKTQNRQGRRRYHADQGTGFSSRGNSEPPCGGRTSHVRRSLRPRVNSVSIARPPWQNRPYSTRREQDAPHLSRGQVPWERRPSN
jgi:hypothetical protein